MCALFCTFVLGSEGEGCIWHFEEKQEREKEEEEEKGLDDEEEE